METRLSKIEGFWAGVLVHLENVLHLYVYLTASGDRIDGRYELPEVEGGSNRGSFTGSLQGDTLLKIELSQDDPHGRLEFELRLAESHGKFMLHGIVPFPGAEVPLGTVTLYSLARYQHGGIWPVHVRLEK